MASRTAPRIHLGPDENPLLAEGIRRGGGVLVPLAEAEAVVWAQGPETFPDTIPDAIRWVQLPFAGIEPWLAAGVVDSARTWTSAAGAYSGSVAEHSIMMLLAGVRSLREQLAATSWRKDEFDPRVGTVRGSTVAIVGCGGIGRALIPYLAASGARVLAVTRSGTPVPGADETLPADRLDEVWARADHFVVAAPATAATHNLIGRPELARMSRSSWIVNVARGTLIDTDALVDALRAGTIGGAALDVTDPEPLPDGHPLWTLPNALITPHVANPATGLPRALADHVAGNVARFAAGEQLAGVIDPVAGY
ncbi:D-isomer specific 2-hydroxyacid dehydrogenase family protein [Rhodococcus kronopolitis]|uniref:D-isomer specific 2-hydroxyacid dehydrogenase family protein n=1 Tax=Rhodococcus kronopolitis TaxID=1460226 RepID=A0ABV9FV87_9NOCA